MKRRRKLTLSAVLLLGTAGLGLSPAVLAEACSYREALMAFEQGNPVRGMALMRMASNDGDKRATDFLATQDYLVDPTISSEGQQVVAGRTSEQN